jgi:hypothetical protein
MSSAQRRGIVEKFKPQVRMKSKRAKVYIRKLTKLTKQLPQVRMKSKWVKVKKKGMGGSLLKSSHLYTYIYIKKDQNIKSKKRKCA